MKATNQGFVDLHSPTGFFLIGTCFLVLSIIIIAGGIYGRRLADRDREQRRQLKDQLERQRHQDHPGEA